jgi:hypothetical protein
MVRLTVTRDELEAGSEMEHNIKKRVASRPVQSESLLETGRALPTWAQ